ncbi:MAG TPA: hypothetical protein VNO26_05570 [Candidatus Limnocylindria bacterium]|nr:hypothetical protein [Candidatus Limnocylindria bacterium]
MELNEIDEETAKKRVQEATWAGIQRVVVLIVTFGAGFFAAWLMYGSGAEGAPALRTRVAALDAQIVELKKQRTDAEGKYEVANTRLSQCQADLQRKSTELATLKAAGAQPATP